jgi:hypothetical protein
MKKRGQAAMEFLMTYGWAILVVLVVIGALAYFGVLNPQNILPQKCEFTTGLNCQDHVLSSSTGLTLRLNNGLGKDIRIDEISFDADNNVVDCFLGISNYTLPNGEEANLLLNTTTAWPGSTLCSTQLTQFAGTRVKGDLSITYTNLQTQLSHTVPGTLLTDVE